MNTSIIIPPSPNGYNSDILAIAPDNTIIYGAGDKLVVIKPSIAEETKPEENIRIITSCHPDFCVNSVNINYNWGKPNKYAVSVAGEDKSVRVWNIESLEEFFSHDKHWTIKDESKIIGASFADEERIASASENGTIILCDIIRNEFTILADLLADPKKQAITLTTFSICPHANWLSAFGRKSGLITVVDLRGTGKVLYNLKGHGHQAVVSLSWCPAPVNIFRVKHKLELETSPQTVTDSVMDSGPEETSRKIDDPTIKMESSESVRSSGKYLESAEEKSPIKVENDPTKTEPSTAVKETDPEAEFLFASSARGESKICIWRTGSGGVLQTSLRLPTPKAKYANDAWITLCWAAPTILLISTASGELSQFNIGKPTMDSKQPSYVRLHAKHRDALFCIKCPLFYFDEYNFNKLDVDINVWTVGLEGILCNFNITNKSIQNLFNTLGGSINCIAGSSIDSNTIALGTADRKIKLWYFSTDKKKIQEFESKVFYDQIYGEVTALAWHPIIDGVLAWGTKEGKIGVTEVFTEKASIIAPQYFKNKIHKLEWGPDAKEEKFLLFALSEGSVVIFDMDALKDAPQVITLPFTDTICTMAWKPDFSALLISTNVELFFKLTPKLSDPVLCHADFQLEMIVWHSDAAEKRPEHYSKYSQVFAAASKRQAVLKIVDLSVVEEQTNKQVIAKFTLPKAPKACSDMSSVYTITAIQWNPLKKHYLVAVCLEGVAFVLDIETETIISTYVNPCINHFLEDSSLSSVYWSPANENLIALGANQKLIVYNYLNLNCPDLDYSDIDMSDTDYDEIIKSHSKAMITKYEKKITTFLSTQLNRI